MKSGQFVIVKMGTRIGPVNLTSSIVYAEASESHDNVRSKWFLNATQPDNLKAFDQMCGENGKGGTLAEDVFI